MWRFSSCLWGLPFRWRYTPSIPRIATQTKRFAFPTPLSSEEQVPQQIVHQSGQVALFAVGGAFLPLAHLIRFRAVWYTEVDGEGRIHRTLDRPTTVRRTGGDQHTKAEQLHTSQAQRARALVLHGLPWSQAINLNIAGIAILSHLRAGIGLPVLGALLQGGDQRGGS